MLFAAFLTFLGLCALSSHSFAEAESHSLVVGIVPQQSATKLAANWTPVLEYLSKKSGLKLRFATAPNIPEFEKRCAAGSYDIAYMNPYHYTVFSKQPGYRAIAKEKLKSLKGILVVRKENPIKDVKELDGSTLAFPSPAAFAASILTRAYLAKRNVHFTPRYVSSHDSVYRAVAQGLLPAGGGVPRTFNNVAPDIRAQLRILWMSKGYTPHAIALLPRVGTDTSTRILQALMSMNDDPAAQPLLKKINFKGFAPATDDDWNDVRSLGIELLQ